MHEDPVDCLRDRVIAMEHNLDTLRTRLTQVADLRDAQGIREDHRAIIERLNEVEEYATVHTLREFMSKICRLEAMFTGEDGGVIFEAIRHTLTTSMLGFVPRTGTMKSPITKKMRKWKINLALRIDHLEDDDRLKV